MPHPGDDRAEPHREGQHQDNSPPGNRGEGREIVGMGESVAGEGVFFNNLLNTHSFVHMEEVAQRQDDIREFWAAFKVGKLRSDILYRYEVDSLVVGNGDRNALRTIVSRNVGDRSTAQREPSLQLRYENDDFSVYRIAK